MSADIRIISTNIAQGTPELPHEDVAALNNTDFMHGSHYGTLILPEFSEVYTRSVVHLLRGIVIQSLDDTPLPSGELVRSTVFGFNEVSYITPDDQRTKMLVPSLGRIFLPLLGEHRAALHAYHTNFIHTANDALVGLESPYRLEPLPD